MKYEFNIKSRLLIKFKNHMFGKKYKILKEFENKFNLLTPDEKQSHIEENIKNNELSVFLSKTVKVLCNSKE